jgi:membrane-bound lytic murein transglycosylase F
MLLFAFSFGIGLYFITEPPKSMPKKETKVEVITPQIDTDENVDQVQALILFHAADYFVYRGSPIGFQHDMLKELEIGLGRNINIRLETDAKKLQKEIFNNNYDIIIMDYAHSDFLRPFIERSIPHSFSYPVLVSGNETDRSVLKEIVISSDFSAKVFFANDSPYQHHLILKNDSLSSEELFEKVDNGETLYLICDYNQAITLMPFYSNVQIIEKAGPQFERRWFFNKKNKQLNEDINHWLLDFKKTKQYHTLIKKYFSKESSFISTPPRKQKKGISQYDDIIKKFAQRYQFDWRFVASIMFQETKFTSGLTGKGGSFGLMQLMPTTMEYHGISELDCDEANILAGIQHLNLIRKSFEDVKDEDEKLYFIASSYNAGRGHIFDAQRLCIKYNADHNQWKNVSKYLALKSKHEFATDSVVKWGYFPGSHTVKYTQQVMERYFLYKITY